MCSPEPARPWISFPELILILSHSPHRAKSPDRLFAPCSVASKLLGGTPTAASATAMGSTAQTTTVRQLASFDSGAFVGSSWSRPATATSPCSTVGRFAGELIHGRREPTCACYKGRSPDSSEHPGSLTPSFSYPLSCQSKRGGRLQPLRSARPPARPGQFRRTKTSPALPNATV